ncbi:hypothetical protein CZ765_06340 [Corynebacterium casei]|nr:hypothetical protein CZ765_06340 [Corynebacterium casei]
MWFSLCTQSVNLLPGVFRVSINVRLQRGKRDWALNRGEIVT